MPGNIITINGSKKLEWYVGDSKMDKLIEYLNHIGEKEIPVSVTKNSKEMQKRD